MNKRPNFLLIIFLGEEKVILKGGRIGAWVDLIRTIISNSMLLGQDFSVDHEIPTEIGALGKNSVRGIGHNVSIVEKFSRIGSLSSSKFCMKLETFKIVL